MQMPGETGMKARGRIRTDAEGRYWFRSIRPTFYPVPTDGPVGRMLRKMGRHPYRPGHIHMIVSAPGHLPVTTHLFVAGSEYLDSDAVFGMKESLVANSTGTLRESGRTASAWIHRFTRSTTTSACGPRPPRQPPRRKRPLGAPRAGSNGC